MMRHTICVLVENRFGVLSHISGLFAGRGVNIDSLAVGETEDPTISRMTVIVTGDENDLEQIVKQLNRLIDVIKVVDLTGEKTVERELMIVRVSSEGSKRSEIIEIVDIFRANIVNVAPRSLTIEVTGDEDKVTAMVEMLRPYGIQEVVRTGKVAIARR